MSRLLPFKPARIVYTASKQRPIDLESPAFRTLAEDDYIQLHKSARGTLPVPMENVTELRELARVSDVVMCVPADSVLASFNKSTYHVVDAEFLAAMKCVAANRPTAYLVNVARGPLVDTDALVSALRSRQITSAALDVVEGEPNIPADHPLLAPDIADYLVIAPHIASATSEARHTMADVCANNTLGALGIGEMVFEVK